MTQTLTKEAKRTLESDRIARILKSDRRYHRLCRDIAAGVATDPGADGPASLQRKIVQEAIAIAGTAGKTQTVRRVADECALDRFYHRPNSTLTPQQYAAGLRFRRAWLRSARRARVTQTYDTQEIERGGDLAGQENTSYAREIVTSALDVLTSAQRRAVVAVCGEDERVGMRGKTLCAGLESLHALWSGK
ncbi:hypothetical protein K6L44_06565 [Gluconacetobacter entanii]|uniref:hypothetical protein n=1 Tax=Gluconacetobacter entanii TaxID=108528 RepID=UPI001C935DC4|nr:hypothetical protein [Gluconacetobacter entanii]MCE2579567.1 hypothetical protein [Komagataeibacter sp. FNDCR1]BCZ76046.1 hypothetical protein [Komagataeibacter phage phiKX1]BCZ76119.1 hypothetical protein [Komagataeibacter phage phiKX2]MBY4639664.1 hypothetical protein [Gluconacetobacter entanii]MCW4579640.1 hypothetical protein [Gluconacetobacter entanii]